jgi:DNA-directed RNA polymerase subunit omega
MTLIEPKMDKLLDETENDRFLLCSIASKRAHDINDMMRGQRDRAVQLQSAIDIARATNKKPLSIAFAEVAREDVSYDPTSIDAKNH